jgi:hypothetical protein
MNPIDVVAEAHREALGSGNVGLHVPARKNVDAWLRTIPDLPSPSVQDVVDTLQKSPYAHIFKAERASTSWLAKAVKNVLPTLELTTCVNLAMKPNFLVCADPSDGDAKIQPKTLHQLVHCMHQIWLPISEGATQGLRERWKLLADLKRKATVIFKSMPVNVEEDDLISKWGEMFHARLIKLPPSPRVAIAKRIFAKAKSNYVANKSVSNFMQACFDIEYDLSERGMCDGAKEVLELYKEVSDLYQ